MYETLLFQTDARGVATITLNRPASFNALDDVLLRELTHAFRRCDAAPNIRVVVMTGAGKAFCAGGDINWMKRMSEVDRAGRLVGSRTVADMLVAADSCGKPVIARVNGAAFGGGAGLAAAADSTIAAESARFSFSEVRLGLVPANISPFVVRRIGAANARRYALSGRPFLAPEAAAIGLAHVVVPDADLDAAVEAEIATYLEAAPEAIRLTKQLIEYVRSHSDADNMGYTANLLADAWETGCGREGIASFLEKKTPSWRS